tara:strand:+ start:223 stop:444 length:222 start_codon:yes stop_codon:yes gene_type:complete
VNQQEKAVCMNTPYISVLRVLEIVDKSINEYDKLYAEARNSHEKKVGRLGKLVSIKIKNNIINDIKQREGDFD